MATENLGNIAILSQKGQEQVSYFNLFLLGEQKNFLTVHMHTRNRHTSGRGSPPDRFI